MTLQNEIENAIEDSAKFSNFAQDVKMKYWDKEETVRKIRSAQIYNENLIDEVLLIVWNNYDVRRKN